MNGEPGSERGRLHRAARSVRSGLRRYPRAIAESVLSRPGAPSLGVAEFLHHLAPHDLAASWLGHSGVVCQIGDTVVAVDPVLSDRIGLRIGKKTIGPARQAPSPVTPEALRGVDLVLITHAHFDHLDRPTLEAMADARTEVVVPRSCGRLIPAGFAKVTELHAGRAELRKGVEITAIEPRHWGARVGVDRHRAVNSYVVRAAGSSVLFAGDTAMTDVFDRKGPNDSTGRVDLAVFGIGAYDPWEHMHATPEQVWAMFCASGARFLMPVHHSTFELSDEPIDEPMRRLLDSAGKERPRVLDTAPGDVVVVDAVGDA
ncbi:MAG: L-ascorbate metabolism protein UlaG (beta-lactamase superfamily) [Phycisphaerales bacterium]|jgi:L-ascorbate metabolism protein UlaG (beta-lactamase superfamily)